MHLFRIQGREVPDDQRLIALADVRDLTILRDEDGRVRGLPQLERILDACLDSLRAARSADRELARLDWNRVKLYVWPVVDATLAELDQVIRSLAPRTEGLGLEQVMVQFTAPRTATGEPSELMLRMSRPPGAGLTLRVTDPPPQPLRELNAYTQKVIRARRRGTVYPYELIPLITRSPGPRRRPGTFTEYDLDDAARRCRWTGHPAEHGQPGARRGQHADQALPRGHAPGRAAGRPDAGAGRARRAGVPPGARRHRAGPELRAPVEWFAISAGAKISMDSGTETMDWISRALAASSSSLRTAARSTSWSPASMSAPSRTGTPRPPC